MKMLVYGCTAEEKVFFHRYAPQYGVELTLLEEKIGPATAPLSAGMDCVNVLSDVVLTPEIYDIFRRGGVRLAVTRTIGYEHMNLPAAQKAGIAVCNITYSPASVADFAILLMLMVTRNIKPMLQRYAAQDYTYAGLRGRELPNLTVGIVGYGRIGRTVARHLQGFGCKVLAWNRRELADDAAEFVPLDDLLSRSDIVTLHLASTPETVHFMDREKFEKMRPGSILINTGRGPLVDSKALIEALESGHLSGAGLDMFDGDRTIYYRDFKNRMVIHHDKAILDSMPNVVMLPHAAFYTDQASEDMVHNSLVGARLYFDGKENPFLLP